MQAPAQATLTLGHHSSGSAGISTWGWCGKGGRGEGGDQRWTERRKKGIRGGWSRGRGGSKVDGRKGNEGSGRLEEKAEGGHQRRTHGLPSILLADCSGGMKDASAQGAERIDHV